ncbi:MAG: ABC transporter ATP-binding protein [Firmicutes bacterium]|nr:ABC transporter ATP-binding protein [Bacillota bacterium]
MWRLFKNFNKKDCVFITIAVIGICTQVWLELKMPDYMSSITRLVQTEGSEMGEIIKNGVYMLMCAGGSLISAIIVGYFASHISATLSMRIRKQVFDKVGQLGMHEVKMFSTSSLITRTTNDITQIQMLVGMGMQMLIKAPITAVWAVTKILNKGFEWSVLTGGMIVILGIFILILMKLVIPKFKVIQRLTDRLNGITRENLNGIRVVRAFNAEQYQEDKFTGANDELTNTQLFTQRAMAFMSPIMYMVMYFLTLGIYFIGAYLIKEALMVDKLTIFSNMVVFSAYAMQVIMSFIMLAAIFIILPRAQVSANRILEVLDAPITIQDGDFDGNTEEKGCVEFRNVSFKYPDGEDYLLKNISFKAKKGETIAIIGATGSGKSSLINLIPRFYDVTSGDVLVDGINVKEYKQEALRNKIGYVSQKAVMFDNSVAQNVAYGENGKGEITEQKIKEAIAVAQGKDFVEAMEEGYNSRIAQGGTNVSGGQKQRLSIARAIARDPEIYIFDDSFSALDYKTDATLRKELKKYTKEATSFIVAQRIGTILNADQILVLEDGECVGIGTHKELLKTCEVYKEIAHSQLSQEELENA